jgi:hypothetical protein
MDRTISYISFCINMPSPKLSDYELVALEYARKASTAFRTKLHIAFLYGRGGVLIGMATNRLGTRSRGAGFSEFTIHAERAVLKAVGDTSLLRGATMVVVRVSKEGKMMNSAPCTECRPHLEKAMRLYGLRKVFFSSGGDHDTNGRAF